MTCPLPLVKPLRRALARRRVVPTSSGGKVGTLVCQLFLPNPRWVGGSSFKRAPRAAASLVLFPVRRTTYTPCAREDEPGSALPLPKLENPTQRRGIRFRLLIGSARIAANQHNGVLPRPARGRNEMITRKIKLDYLNLI